MDAILTTIGQAVTIEAERHEGLPRVVVQFGECVEDAVDLTPAAAWELAVRLAKVAAQFDPQ